MDLIRQLKMDIGEIQLQQKSLVNVINLNFVIQTMSQKHIHQKMIYALKDKQVQCAYLVIFTEIFIGDKNLQAQVKDV